jgi:hypothetical protein
VTELQAEITKLNNATKVGSPPTLVGRHIVFVNYVNYWLTISKQEPVLFTWLLNFPKFTTEAACQRNS